MLRLSMNLVLFSIKLLMVIVIMKVILKGLNSSVILNIDVIDIYPTFMSFHGSPGKLPEQRQKITTR
jgi:hypothetical protein